MPTQMLSPHFTLQEMSVTSQRLPNTPTSPVVIANLSALCLQVLEGVRKHYGKPITIHSAYRSPDVNSAVGGSDRSQHMRGEAADFQVSGRSVYEVASWMAENVDFDQLILENFVPGVQSSGWVHCSWTKGNRNDVLTKFKGSRNYYPGILLSPPV